MEPPLRFISSYFKHFGNIPSIKRVSSPCLVLSLNLLMFHTEALMYIPQIITYAIVEKGMENEGEQK